MRADVARDLPPVSFRYVIRSPLPLAIPSIDTLPGSPRIQTPGIKLGPAPQVLHSSCLVSNYQGAPPDICTGLSAPCLPRRHSAFPTDPNIFHHRHPHLDLHPTFSAAQQASPHSAYLLQLGVLPTVPPFAPLITYSVSPRPVLRHAVQTGHHVHVAWPVLRRPFVH